MTSPKELVNKPNRFAPGHRTCGGCGIPPIVRTVLRATDKPVVVSNATGCLEVTTTIYPYTSWKVPFIHSAFENAAATLSGVEAAYQSLKKQGKMDKEIKFLAFGGDGGTYDIGLQSLSGTLERGHDVVYVCYDNNAYMNTGIQRSSATPYGAATTTTPDGRVHHGKEEFKKDLAKVGAAHKIPYVGQTALHRLDDLYEKAKKAFETEGPCLIICLQPCTLGWRFPTDKTVKISKLATETNFWPIFEVEYGKYKLNYKPTKPRPVMDYIKEQGRFKHLLDPKNAEIVEKIQAHVNEEWERLLKLCGE